MKENISRILADNYFQAASSNCDMFRITDILEEVRKSLETSENFRRVEDRLGIHLGENLENDNEFGIVQRLTEQIRQLKRDHYKEVLQETFRKDENEGWQKWQQFFAYELTKANNKNLDFLLDLKTPSKNNEDFLKIKNLLPFFREERWMECLPLFDYFIELENIPIKVKADLQELTAQVYMYHFWDLPEALKHIEEIQTLIPGSAKAERIYGEYYIQNKEYDKARKHLTKALDIDKKDFENYLVLGNLYKAENRYATAESWYNEGIRENPGKADLYNRLLLLNEHSAYYENHEKDIDDLLEKIIKLDSDFTFTATGNAGFVYQKNGNFDKAEEYYKRVIELFPERIQGYTNLGYCFLEKNDLQQAEEAFKKAIEIDPKVFDGYWGLVTLNRKKEDWDGVISYLKFCEKYRPEWLPYIYNDYGNAYEKLKDLGNAQKYYLLALKNDPQKTLGLSALLDIAELDLPKEQGHSLLKEILGIKGDDFEESYHYRAGVICYKNQSYKQAVGHFEKATSTIETDPVKLEYVGLAQEKSGNLKEAEIAFRKAIDVASSNKSKYHNRLAFFLTNQGRYNEAIEILDKAIQLKPEPLYHENRGYAYEMLGDRESAEPDYRKALELATSDKDTYENRLGIFYYNQRNYDRAIQHYINAIELFPKSVYYENIGLAYEYSGDLENAEESYKKALELSKTDRDIYENRLGVFYYNRRNYKKSIEHYINAIKQNPKPVYHENIGLAYEYSGDPANAGENYKKAIELATYNKDRYYNRLGFFLSGKGKQEEAIPLFEKALELRTDAVYLENLGFSLEKLGQLNEAEDLYRKALEISPNERDVYLNRLGIFYFNQNKYDDAISYYQKAIDFYPKAVYYENLGNAYLDSGDFIHFEEAFLKAIELAPREGKYFFQLGWRVMDQFRDTGKTKEYLHKALEIFRETPEIEPEELLSIQFLGAAYQQEGNLEKAEEIFTEAYNIDPNNDLICNFLGKVFLDKKDYNKALDYYEKALLLKPEKSSNIKNVADVLDMMGDHQKAIEIYRSGIHIDPTMNENIGKVYYRQNDFTNAEKYMRKALDAYPDNYIYLENLGLILQKLQKYDEALDVFNEALELAPIHEKNFFLNYIGNCWYSLNKPEKAETYYKKALEQDPDSKVYFDNLILALKNAGKKEKAIETIEKRLEDDPGNNDLINQLGLLFAEIGDFEKAGNCFIRNIELNPDNIYAYDYLGNVYNKLNQPENESEVYLNALERFPTDSYFLEGFEKSVLKIQDKEKRKSIYNKALTIEGLEKSGLSNIEEQL